ncbi:isoflavone reductase family [Fusarium heterosporum]|uniref:Isoflavone reductase family n=1 Tax=Fusarium heterosporum TaxID=42747 RepID=A0A8H5STW0_FUSHE|nr:isoflavone reductase family [Fusarium heterosporum]
MWGCIQFSFYTSFNLSTSYKRPFFFSTSTTVSTTASITGLRVVVAGASGKAGQSVMKELMSNLKRFDVVALARSDSAGKPVYQEMASAGATIETVNFCNSGALTARLSGADVVISCLLPLQKVESENLVDVAHQAGVGCLVPNFWGSVIPPRGVMGARDLREDLLDRCKRLYLPYTIIDVGMWYQASLPPPFNAGPPIGYTFVGNGDMPTAMIDKNDIGPYVARIITDPRTLNRSVLAYSEVATQRAVAEEVKAVTGKEEPRDSLSAAELEARIAELNSLIAFDPTDIGLFVQLSMYQYGYTNYVRGDNTPEHAKYLGYLDAKALYPDVKCKSLREFIQEVVAGKRDHHIYVGRDPRRAHAQGISIV